MTNIVGILLAIVSKKVVELQVLITSFAWLQAYSSDLLLSKLNEFFKLEK